jgi:RNA polymerase sigma-70 factor (ECF subfamily)
MRLEPHEPDVEPTPPDAGAADSDLIASALAGDNAAFGRLYDRYAALIRAVCHDTTRDLHEAQDLCQEVFLRAYSGLVELRESERFSAWLVGIARMVCREWRRKAARARDLRRRSVVQVGPIRPQEAALEQDAECTRILAEIAKLPERERMAIHLFYLQEHPVEAAQKTMKLSRSGFYRVLERARERLKRALARREALIP